MPPPSTTVSVVGGGGMMGRRIASELALCGCQVIMQGPSQEELEDGALPAERILEGGHGIGEGAVERQRERK